MKKKFLATMMMTVMAVSVTACGSSNNNSGNKNDNKSPEVTESAESGDSTSKSDFKVGMVTDTGGLIYDLKNTYKKKEKY